MDLKSTGLDILAHAAAAAGLTVLSWYAPAVLFVVAIFFVREWDQEQGKTGDYSVFNAWRFWRWSLDKNLEWAVPAGVAIVIDLTV
ncbi:hypothetical protein HW532_21550 [Kaustia mangrovi]|uniref:Uncharacterized protein n=1 Tax=Kaustia mangrovi TaxID=2593653 RepID=A0A7S8C7V0_9HYPH|nr:hypothetical protein [Kaustia mangrovi]QPC45053.1 hypothetical protein HW532_21550 [Kaustia mangrovi]